MPKNEYSEERLTREFPIGKRYYEGYRKLAWEYYHKGQELEKRYGSASAEEAYATSRDLCEIARMCLNAK